MQDKGLVIAIARLVRNPGQTCTFCPIITTLYAQLGQFIIIPKNLGWLTKND